MSPREHLSFVGAHLGMFGLDRGERFERAVAYVSGYDDGQSGQALDGFREWLVTNCEGGDHLHWSGLIRVQSTTASSDEADQDALVSCLFSSLDEFFQVLEDGGLAAIGVQYEAWKSGDSVSDG